MSEDEKYMQLAIEEARQALTCEEIPVGCIIVCNGQIVGRGHNLTETLQDHCTCRNAGYHRSRPDIGR